MPDGTRPAPPDDTCRVVLQGTVLTMPWAMVLWLQLTAASRTSADLAAVLTAMSASYDTRFKPLVKADTVLSSITGVWITPGGGEVVATNNTTRTGTNASATIQNVASCVVLDWRIDQYYRGGKPRSYFPGLTVAHSTDGIHLTGAGITAWQTAAEGFRGDVNAATSGAITNVKLGTVSFQRANAWRTPPVFYPYTAVGVRSTIGIQRRRLLL